MIHHPPPQQEETEKPAPQRRKEKTHIHGHDDLHNEETQSQPGDEKDCPNGLLSPRHVPVLVNVFIFVIQEAAAHVLPDVLLVLAKGLFNGLLAKGQGKDEQNGQGVMPALGEVYLGDQEAHSAPFIGKVCVVWPLHVYIGDQVTVCLVDYQLFINACVDLVFIFDQSDCLYSDWKRHYQPIKAHRNTQLEFTLMQL